MTKVNLIRAVIFIHCLVFLNFFSTGQDLKSLSIGERMPDIEITGLINHSSDRVRFSDLKGKLVILDFWGTTCATCLRALPKIDSLQRQFGNSIQILTITNYDTEQKVKQTFLERKYLKGVYLPVVLNDSKLKQLFPHELISHVVWIDPKGIVKAITGTEYITAGNIEKVLKGERIDWPVKIDNLEFDHAAPIFKLVESIQTKPNFGFYSAFTGHLDGIGSSNKQFTDSANGMKVFNYFNLSLLNLCDMAVQGDANPYNKNVILNVRDHSKYLRGLNYEAEWDSENTYCYSISLPLKKAKGDVHSVIREDLKRWLANVMGITVKKEKRLVNILALVRINKDNSLLKTKGGEPDYDLANTSGIKKLKNSDISDLLWYLNEETPDIPWVFNETGIPASLKVDIELRIKSCQDIPALRKELQRYGLDLVEVKREMEIVVIEEK